MRRMAATKDLMPKAHEARSFTEQEVLAIARRARNDPASLTLEEIRAVAVYVSLKQSKPSKN